MSESLKLDELCQTCDGTGNAAHDNLGGKEIKCWDCEGSGWHLTTLGRNIVEMLERQGLVSRD